MFQDLPFLKIFLIIFMIIVSNQVKGQFGEGRLLEFLNLPDNARISALGGVNVSNLDKDVNMFLSNPALLEAPVNQNISLNHFLFLADVSLSTLTYAHDFDKLGMMAIGLKYLNYGTIEAYDQTGLEEGTFNANDYAITIGNSHNIGSFTMGGSIKFASSNIAAYHSSALLIDFGGLYKHPNQDLTVGLVMKNLGFGLSSYISGNRYSFPFDVQMGMSFKPEFMPFRFSITAYNLSSGYQDYQVPVRGSLNNNQEPGSVDRIIRHFTFGTELLLSKNVNFRAGYNHLIKQELSIEERSGGAGLAFGILIRVKAFEIAYSKALYHVAGGTDYFTLTSNLNTLFKNRKNFNEQNETGK